jgi:hypothetical protein
MRTLAALVVLACTAFAVNSQDPAKVDFTAYGEPGFEAAQKAADGLGVDLKLRGVSEEDLDVPCWAMCKGAARSDVAELLSIAIGHPVSQGPKALTVYMPLTAPPEGRVKGYDVSVPSGRFVEYVNAYGSAKVARRPGEDEHEERTAAEYLASLIDDLLYDPRGCEVEASIVGDRLLYTLDDAGHARVREVLDLLMAEHGGESAALKADRALVEKLKQGKFKGDLSGTPVSSVIGAICGEAGVSVVLGCELGALAVDWHIDFVQAEEVSAWDALQKLFVLLNDQEFAIEVCGRAGAAAVELRGGGIQRGYRVYDVSELLKKLAASYQRQRTAPDKEEGFGGDVRAQGGSAVVVDALEEQLAALDLAEGLFIEAYGARLVVRGGAGSIDAATGILKEMGWEE